MSWCSYPQPVTIPRQPNAGQLFLQLTILHCGCIYEWSLWHYQLSHSDMILKKVIIRHAFIKTWMAWGKTMSMTYSNLTWQRLREAYDCRAYVRQALIETTTLCSCTSALECYLGISLHDSATHKKVIFQNTGRKLFWKKSLCGVCSFCLKFRERGFDHDVNQEPLDIYSITLSLILSRKHRDK